MVYLRDKIQDKFTASGARQRLGTMLLTATVIGHGITADVIQRHVTVLHIPLGIAGNDCPNSYRSGVSQSCPSQGRRSQPYPSTQKGTLNADSLEYGDHKRAEAAIRAINQTVPEWIRGAVSGAIGN